MKKMKINIIISVFVAIIMLLTTNIYAATLSLNAGISSDKQIATQGDQVIITISLKDFQGTGQRSKYF